MTDGETKIDLTVCSVAFESTDFLSLNYELTARLNPTSNWRWLIVDNSPLDSPRRFPRNDPRFTVIDGIEPTTVEHPMKISMHHALGLEKSLAYFHSPFVLYLDPDFYIVRKNWINLVVGHLRRSGLAFFGSPYHPQWHEQYRYFPCLHCTFIDLSKIQKQDLDFKPGENLTLVRRLKAATSFRDAVTMLPQSAAQGAYEWGRLLWRLTLGRKRIGRTQDTGSRVFRRFAAAPGVLNETLVPVFDPVTDTNRAAHIFSYPARMLEAILPDHLCYLPKRHGYFTKSGFKSFGLPDLHGLGWEEFLWQGRPFGFHLHRHRYPESVPSRESELRQIQLTIDRALSSV